MGCVENLLEYKAYIYAPKLLSEISCSYCETAQIFFCTTRCISTGEIAMSYLRGKLCDNRDFFLQNCSFHRLFLSLNLQSLASFLAMLMNMTHQPTVRYMQINRIIFMISEAPDFPHFRRYTASPFFLSSLPSLFSLPSPFLLFLFSHHLLAASFV